MESLGHQPRSVTEESIECWDDDGDLQFAEGLQFRATSSAGSITNSSFRPSGHRDSISSRRSARSDLDSNAGDEDWQVFLQDNDEFSKEEALVSAKNAGIPIPADIPSSALIGGAIKRLSTRKHKRTFVDDWSEDVELPDPDTVLELRTPQDTTFPDNLRQISSAATSPIKTTASPAWNEDISTRLQSAFTSLDRYQDENDSPTNQIVPTIRPPIPRSPEKKPVSSGRTTTATTAAATAAANTFQEPEADDDFDLEIELPPDHQPLQLSQRKQHTGVSSPTLEDFDLEWSEGSIGVRVGGTTRDGRSVPSSSISIASPSVSSCLTGESEEDGLDGIVFPEGPLDFSASLKKRQDVQASVEPETQTPPPSKPKPQPLSSDADADDFFSGIEVDSGKAFSSGKLALNPNVKCKTEWPTSPTRRPATTLTFTNSTTSPRTRIPRLSGHDRTHSTSLETVSESGAPLSKFRRSQSRLGHSAQSSVSSLPASTTPSTSPTPAISTSRRLLGQRAPASAPSPASISREPTSSAGPNPAGRLLRTKRSLPSIRGVKAAEAAQTSQRSPSHPDGYLRSSFGRPKTPVDRTTLNDGRPSSRRPQAPFLPAGAADRQSHHASVKSYRPSRRTNSDGSGDLLSPQSTFSRLSRSSRQDSHRLSLGDSSTDTISPSGKRTLTRPTKRRNFGDGTELESFDDLPTSVSTESRYTKTPIGRGAPRSVRAKLSQSRNTPPVESPGQLSTPPSTSKPSTSIPRFARDTNASRNAREQRIASMNTRNRDPTPLSSFNSNWKPQPITRLSPNAAPVRSRKNRPETKSTSKPHLIKPMGTGVQETKSVRGMRYNPSTYRWEGNENQVQEFDTVSTSRSPKPAPALITNVGTVQNVQTVGGMIFDPHRMCWLRANSKGQGQGQQGHGQDSTADDEDDVFAGLDDLEDKVVGRVSTSMNDFNAGAGGNANANASGLATGEEQSAGESSDEGPITEEFDVGPEFVRRQRAEEEKWKRKVDHWVGSDRGDRETWRWAIRDLVAGGV